jgi:hypothetical protein
MDKTIKSIAGSLAILFIYFYATEGVVRLFISDAKQRTFYIFLTAVLLIILSLILIILPYHIYKPDTVTIIYKLIIYFHFIYLIAGSSINFLIRH